MIEDGHATSRLKVKFASQTNHIGKPQANMLKALNRFREFASSRQSRDPASDMETHYLRYLLYNCPLLAVAHGGSSQDVIGTMSEIYI